VLISGKDRPLNKFCMPLCTGIIGKGVFETNNVDPGILGLMELGKPEARSDTDDGIPMADKIPLRGIRLLPRVKAATEIGEAKDGVCVTTLDPNGGKFSDGITVEIEERGIVVEGTLAGLVKPDRIPPTIFWVLLVPGIEDGMTRTGESVDANIPVMTDEGANEDAMVDSETPGIDPKPRSTLPRPKAETIPSRGF